MTSPESPDGADIVDAEIVETPEAGEPPEAVEPPEAAEPPISAAASAPVWGAPPVPSVPADPITDYTDAGVPTLAYLQDKVEKRYASALGAHELADATIPEVADAAKRRDELAKSAQERLDEIRRSLHPGDSQD